MVEDAQNRGLSQDLWNRRVITALGVAAAVPALLFGIPFGLKGIGLAVVGAGLLLGGIRSRHRQRHTPEGFAAAGRWVAVRKKLEEDEVFQTQPPITVALWERLLAYGAALGVAGGAVRPIPMGAESDRRAWSSYGGHWHQVDVRYPRLYPPAWGKHPVAALLWAALFGGIALLFLYFVSSIVSDLGDVGFLGLLIVAALVLVPLAVVVGAAVLIIRAVADLSSAREVTGEILRLRTRGSDDDKRRYYVAVDDATATTVRAWRVKPEQYHGLEQHEVVAASVTRYLGYVHEFRHVPAAGAAEPQPVAGEV